MSSSLDAAAAKISQIQYANPVKYIAVFAVLTISFIFLYLYFTRTYWKEGGIMVNKCVQHGKTTTSRDHTGKLRYHTDCLEYKNERSTTPLWIGLLVTLFLSVGLSYNIIYWSILFMNPDLLKVRIAGKVAGSLKDDLFY